MPTLCAVLIRAQEACLGTLAVRAHNKKSQLVFTHSLGPMKSRGKCLYQIVVGGPWASGILNRGTFVAKNTLVRTPQIPFEDKALLKKNMDRNNWIAFNVLMQLKSMLFPGHDLMVQAIQGSPFMELREFTGMDG